MTQSLPLLERFEHGEPARLIPVVADTSKEQRVTSALLAAFMVVDEYGKAMLRMAGAPASKSAKIACFTEVSFKNAVPTESKSRNDGLIVVTQGNKQWTALVEAKIGNAELDSAQIEKYLEVARVNSIDAVITISNQYALHPTMHPVQIDARKTKSVALHHWSWMSLLTEAVLLSEHIGISDPEQSYILHEIIRYLQHPSSGIHAFSQMRSGWKDMCTAVQQSFPLQKNSPIVTDSAISWQQLSRYLSLQISQNIGRSVPVFLTRTQAENAENWLQDGLNTLVNEHKLETEFSIPDAASRLRLLADINRRTLTASMRLKAPTDISQARAAITWILKQLSKSADGNLLIRATWPGRTGDTASTLNQLREDSKHILVAGNGLIPTSFEIAKIVDLAGKFKGLRTFVEEAEITVKSFYEDVGQHLKAWTPSAPKVVQVEKMQATITPEDIVWPKGEPQPLSITPIDVPVEFDAESASEADEGSSSSPSQSS